MADKTLPALQGNHYPTLLRRTGDDVDCRRSVRCLLAAVNNVKNKDLRNPLGKIDSLVDIGLFAKCDGSSKCMVSFAVC